MGNNNGKDKDTVKIGFGPAFVSLTTRRENIQWFIIIILAVLTVANGYFLSISRSSARITPFAGDASETTFFSKSHIFWIPKFSDATRRGSDPEVSEAQFHAWLNRNYGGWSRWEVQGGEAESNTEETGWFYLVSTPKTKSNGGIPALLDHLKGYFAQSSFYVIEIPHI